ncbi:MAG: phosphoribosylamine--glycine ligase [Phycisphaerales bacterium]
MSDQTNVLLIGGGGREHSLAWKLKQSRQLGRLFATHIDNPGIAALARPVDCPFEPERPFRLQRFCEKEDIGLVVIGPEEPLAMGLSDALGQSTELDAALTPPGGAEHEIRTGRSGSAGASGSKQPARVVFGPTKDAARLEADKAWAKQMMHAAAVPTADGRSFNDPDAAKRFLESRTSAYVVKAAGLAKGKGVIVPANLDEALAAIDRIMVNKEFGDAGSTVVVEERLKGQEASVLALVDGRNIFVLEPCQDHKRLRDGDEGPNTGGMGVFCPGGITDDATLALIQRQVLVPIVDTLRRDGIEFRGVLYAGIMLTPGGPKVLEFNVRFGDPECQALMTRLHGDLVEILLACGTKHLHEVSIDWKPAASCCVVLASKGYPDKPEVGKVISGLDEASACEGVQVFHAGTRRDPETGRIVTAGGRVLSVVGVGGSLEDARARAYAAAELIRFEGKVMRSDIGRAPAAASSRR